MALNCSMITPNNLPVPLPGEKIFMSVKAVTIHLNPTTPGAGTTSEAAAPVSPTANTLTAAAAASHDAKQKGKLSLSGMLSAISLAPPSDDGSAHGTVYVTNQRILFIADNASSETPLSTDPNPALPEHPPLPPIKTLTIPLRNSFDGRFVQPWLSANYHLSTFIPVPNGNLHHLLSSPHLPPDHANIAQDSFTLKILFNEGHGFEFTEALEEVKNIMYQSECHRSAELEELPTYSPPMADPIPLATGSSFVGYGTQEREEEESAGQEEARGERGGESEGGAGTARDEYLCRRRETLPEADLLLAASVATEEEHRQEQQALSHLPPLQNILPPSLHPPPPADDAPPGYEP